MSDSRESKSSSTSQAQCVVCNRPLGAHVALGVAMCARCMQMQDRKGSNPVAMFTPPAADATTYSEIVGAFEKFSYGPGNYKIAASPRMAAAPPTAKVKGKAKIVDIEFDGYIGGWDGIQAREFARDVKNATKSLGPDDWLKVVINSGGGDVFEATRICNTLDSLPQKVWTHIVGVAASAATAVSQHGEYRTAAANIHFMIHGARGISWGTIDDHRSYVELLENANEILADLYVDATGQSREQILKWIARDTWMTAKKAKARGFVDELTKSQKVTPHIEPKSAVAGMLDAFVSYSPKQVAAATDNFIQLSSRLGTPQQSNGVIDMKFEAWAKSEGYDLASMSKKAIKSLKALYKRIVAGQVDDEDADTDISDVDEASEEDDEDDDSPEDSLDIDLSDDDEDEEEEDEEEDEEDEEDDDDEPAATRPRKKKGKARQALTSRRKERLSELKYMKRISQICQGNMALEEKALANNWSPARTEMEKLRNENRKLKARRKKSSTNYGTFNVVTKSRSEMRAKRDVIEAAVCLEMAKNGESFTEADLLSPFEDMPMRAARTLGFNTEIKAFSEKTLDMAAEAFPSFNIQQLIIHSNRMEGKTKALAWDHDASIEASYTTNTVPAVFKRTVERAIIANRTKSPPKWKSFAGRQSVPNFKPHQRYRVFGTGRWERENEDGTVNNGSVEIDTKHEFRVETEGQYLMIGRQAILNGDFGAISDIARSFVMYGNYAPEFAAWRQVQKTIITPGATPFTFDFANLKLLYQAFQRKLAFDPDTVKKDKARNLAMEVGTEPAVLMSHKVRDLDVAEMLNGDVQVTRGDVAENDPVTRTATVNVFKDKLRSVSSHYVANENGVALIPSPSEAPALRVVLLNGREVPYVTRVQTAPNQVPGYGLMGYIDVDAQDTSEGDLVTTAADI